MRLRTRASRASHILFAATVFAAFATLAQAQGKPEGFAAARALFNEGKSAEAIALLDTHISANPRDAVALVLRGDAKANLGEDLEALKDYNSAIAVDPAYQYAYVTRCETRLDLDEVAGALEDCNMAVKLDPGDESGHEARAEVHYARGAYALALADFDKAISLGSTGAYIYAGRCDAHRFLANMDLARVDCDRALTLNPKSRRALWASGRLAVIQGRHADALPLFTSYIAILPDDSLGGYYWRAYANNRLKNYKDALADIRTYVEGDPEDADAYRERGLALYGTGDRRAAIADLTMARQRYVRDGNHADALHVGEMLAEINAGRAPVP